MLEGHTVRAIACGETFAVAAADAETDRVAVARRSIGADDGGGGVGAGGNMGGTAPAGPTKLFAWGRGMTERCQKFETDGPNSIYLPSIVVLDSDVRRVRGIACHDDALCVLVDSAHVDTRSASDGGATPLARRRSNSRSGMMMVSESPSMHHESDRGLDGDADQGLITSSNSPDVTPVWLREEFAAATAEVYEPASASASVSQSPSRAPSKSMSVDRCEGLTPVYAS